MRERAPESAKLIANFEEKHDQIDKEAFWEHGSRGGTCRRVVAIDSDNTLPEQGVSLAAPPAAITSH